MENCSNGKFGNSVVSYPLPSPWKRLKTQYEDSGYESFNVSSVSSDGSHFHQPSSPCILEAGSYTDPCLNHEPSLYDSFLCQNESLRESERTDLDGSEELKRFQDLHVETFSPTIISPLRRKSPRAKTRCRSPESPSTKIDFLMSLSNSRPVIDKILSFLSDKDLSHITMVSRGWRNICRKNEEAHQRWKTYVAHRKAIKENLVYYPIMKSGGNTPLATMNHSTPLLLRQKRSPPVSPSKIVFRRFQKEAEKLKPNEKLMKCPKCQRPAVCSPKDRALCNGRDCQWEFCTKCLCDFHGTRPCVGSTSPSESPRKKQPAIMSKLSRRNLRRL